MPPSRARQLIFAYAGVLVLLNLSVLLPGNPDYESGWKGAAASLAIQALIVWRLCIALRSLGSRESPSRS